MLEAIERALVKRRPDWVIVYGDTNSTLAGALAAAKLHVRVAHVEAGLRSFDKRMPEEVNRVLADHLSDLLFCPTDVSVRNLEREGITGGVHLVGDVMYDSVLENVALARRTSRVLSQLHLEPTGYALATVHRAENTDDPKRLAAVFGAFEAIAEQDVPIVCPLHPRTRKALAGLGPRRWPRNLSLIDPVPYLDMLLLLQSAKLVLTDSDGVQKEAFILQVPCLTLRDQTEWVETVEAGWNSLVGTDKGTIVARAKAVIEQGSPPTAPLPYGDGHAAERIVEVLSSVSQ
jgi:UDP-N-acetylglucosamine 2-epimerase